MSLRQLNHWLKIGPLAVDYAIPLSTRISAVNLFDVYRLRATCLSIPKQVETHTLLHFWFSVEILAVTSITRSLIDSLLKTILRKLITSPESTEVQGQSRLKVVTSDHGNIRDVIPSGATPEVELGVELFGGTSTTQDSQKVESLMSQNGGKIAEKANAIGNSVDIGYYLSSRGHSRTFLMNGLNSVRLVSTSERGLFRTGSYDARESRRHPGIFDFVKSMSTLT